MKPAPVLGSTASVQTGFQKRVNAGEAWNHFGKALHQWPGLVLTRLGLNYSARIVLGKNLTRMVTKCAFKVRAALHATQNAFG